MIAAKQRDREVTVLNHCGVNDNCRWYIQRLKDIEKWALPDADKNKFPWVQVKQTCVQGRSTSRVRYFQYKFAPIFIDDVKFNVYFSSMWAIQRKVIWQHICGRWDGECTFGHQPAYQWLHIEQTACRKHLQWLHISLLHPPFLIGMHRHLLKK